MTNRDRGQGHDADPTRAEVESVAAGKRTLTQTRPVEAVFDPTISPGKRTLTGSLSYRAEPEPEPSFYAPYDQARIPAAEATRRGHAAEALAHGAGEYLIAADVPRPAREGRHATVSEVPHRALMEATFGEDFSTVRAHLGASASLATMGARAAAHGDTVAFGSSMPEPALVAHELTHVVQSRRAGAASMALSREQSSPDDPAEREAEQIAAIVDTSGSASPHPVAVREAPSASVHFDRDGGTRAAPDGPTPVARFLRGLTAASVRQTPDPLLLESRRASGSLVIQAVSSESPLDATAQPLAVRINVLDAAGQNIAAGERSWVPGQRHGPSLPVTILRAGDYRAVVEVGAGDPGVRQLDKRLQVRTPDLQSAQSVNNEQLETDAAAMDQTLATERDPEKREAALKASNEMEWVAHQRGLATGDGPAALGTLPIEPAAVRRHLERVVGEHGLVGAGIYVWQRMRSQDPQYTVAAEQLALLNSEATVFRSDFRSAARDTAQDMLDESEAAIGAALAPYGIDLDRGQLNAIGSSLMHREDVVTGPLVDHLVRRSKASEGKPRDPATPSAAQSREGLAKAARDLLDLQVEVRGLTESRARLYSQWHKEQSARDHASHHPVPNPDDAWRVVDRLPTAGPGSSGVAISFPNPPAELPFEAKAAWIESDLKIAKAQLQTTWLEHERAHPVLATFRDQHGNPQDLQRLAQGGGEEALRNALLSVLPKLGNIYRTRASLGDEVSPLSLPPVVELTKQRLRVSPSSFRAAIARDEVATANAKGWKDWAIAAVTVGLAVLSAAPTGGGSLLVGAKIGAEIGGLALDAYLAVEAYDKYQALKGASDTNLDKARSLSAEEPSLTWLAVQIAALPVGGAFALKTFREAAVLHRAAAVGRVGPEAIARLDALGAEQGLGAIGTRIANDAGQDAGKAAHVAERGASGADTAEIAAGTAADTARGTDTVVDAAADTAGTASGASRADTVADAAGETAADTARLTPEAFGLQTISSNQRLLDMWNDAMRQAHASPRMNAYKRYLQMLEDGVQPTDQQLRQAFGVVRERFARTASAQGLHFSDIHHWNFPMKDFPQQAVDSRHLVPTPRDLPEGTPDPHVRMHRETSSGHPYNDPVSPDHTIILPDVSTPLKAPER